MDGGEEQRLVKIGRWEVRPTELRLSDGSEEHALEAKVMDVLLALIEAQGQVVLREDLINNVWGTEFGGDESLTRAISLLRKAFGDTRGQHEHIRTVPRKGYQLIAPITQICSAASPNSDVETLQPMVDGSAAVQEPPEAASEPSQRHRARILTLGAAVILIGIVIFGRGLMFPPSPQLPLVMVMDSAHPSRVYDDSVRQSGGTNADILSDILSDLPVVTQKELISPNWHRHEAIMQFEPDLIVIHYSGFKQEDARGPRPQLKLLIEYFLKTDTEFLVYSRASEAWLANKMDIVLEDLRSVQPNIDDRVQVFALLEHGEPNWSDQTTAQGIKLQIKAILELE